MAQVDRAVEWTFLSLIIAFCALIRAIEGYTIKVIDLSISLTRFNTGVSPEIVIVACQRVIFGQNLNFSKNVNQPVIVWQVNTTRKKKQNCCLLWLQSPLRPCLFTGANGTDVPSALQRQARPIPPLLELWAPSHRSNERITSRASSFGNHDDIMVISAVLNTWKNKATKTWCLCLNKVLSYR
jgi:hypothetical protein